MKYVTNVCIEDILKHETRNNLHRIGISLCVAWKSVSLGCHSMGDHAVHIRNEDHDSWILATVSIRENKVILATNI